MMSWSSWRRSSSTCASKPPRGSLRTRRASVRCVAILRASRPSFVKSWPVRRRRRVEERRDAKAHPARRGRIGQERQDGSRQGRASPDASAVEEDRAPHEEVPRAWRGERLQGRRRGADSRGAADFEEQVLVRHRKRKQVTSGPTITLGQRRLPTGRRRPGPVRRDEGRSLRPEPRGLFRWFRWNPIST